MLEVAMIMLKKMLTFALLFSAAGVSFADINTLKTRLAQQYPNVKITNIQPTEMTGLYSAVMDHQVVYINEQAQHLFVGSMIRLKDHRNLTKDLVLENGRIEFNKLPLQDAIKTIKGNGQRKLVVFSDPNCPYCKTLDQNLQQLNNVTIYTFLYPLKAQSIIPSKQVWCSNNPAFAWGNLIQKGIQPSAAATCQTPIERNLALGEQLGLEGTPAIIFENGQKVMGAYPAEEIEKLWQKMALSFNN
jgi:thiol:disulfide interchange protein DsbC